MIAALLGAIIGMSFLAGALSASLVAYVIVQRKKESRSLFHLRKVVKSQLALNVIVESAVTHSERLTRDLFAALKQSYEHVSKTQGLALKALNVAEQSAGLDLTKLDESSQKGDEGGDEILEASDLNLE